MPVDVAIQKLTNLSAQITRDVVGILFPNDIDVYLLALELTTSNNDTIDYFLWPILPNELQKTEPKRTNIKMSAGGVTVLTNNAFVPEQLILKGNFGRRFRIFLDVVKPTGTGIDYSTEKGVYDLTAVNSISEGRSLAYPKFLEGVKTGYGAFKVLKAMINKANGIDRMGKPFKLYFYNLALGENYLVSVPPQGFTCNQNLDQNMIWNYTLNLEVIAPAQSLRSFDPNSNLTLLGSSVLTNLANDTASVLRQTIQSIS